VGQHIADAAAEMVRRGYRVIVYTSARGYDDPSRRYSSREFVDGVDIRRLPFSSFGKASIAMRLSAQVIFLLQATLLGLFMRDLSGLMITTVPPFCSVAGVVIGKLRRVPVKYWLMDLNPDQIVAMNILPESSMVVRIFNSFNRAILNVASDVVVLDRFMLERISRRFSIGKRIHILPPWSHEDSVLDIPHSDNYFRRQHIGGGILCLMYSGNHSPANPFTSVLDAVSEMQDESRLILMCIGGGLGKRDVDNRIAKGAANIRSLPYQPLDQTRFSLSAADVHLISMGNEMVGIVHPCKVYGAMTLSRPILFVGPSPSHITDLIERHQIGWQIPQGDVSAARLVLRQILATPRGELEAMGRRASTLMACELSKKTLLTQFCDLLEIDVPIPRPKAH
jgi:hypothetical protein